MENSKCGHEHCHAEIYTLALAAFAARATLTLKARICRTPDTLISAMFERRNVLLRDEAPAIS